MARIMSATISRHDGEIFREDVDDLALALVPPLRTYNDRGLALLQIQLRGRKIARLPSPPCRVAHTSCTREDAQLLKSWGYKRSRCVPAMIPCLARYGQLGVGMAGRRRKVTGCNVGIGIRDFVWIIG